MIQTMYNHAMVCTSAHVSALRLKLVYDMLAKHDYRIGWMANWLMSIMAQLAETITQCVQ